STLFSREAFTSSSMALPGSNRGGDIVALLFTELVPAALYHPWQERDGKRGDTGHRTIYLWLWLMGNYIDNRAHSLCWTIGNERTSFQMNTFTSNMKVPQFKE
ncbi:MAG: hypothetical protein HYX80_09535, partial [Chloroflexi bacterium]|nr:hypothetical protein [Chloroflexota bacterium]